MTTVECFDDESEVSFFLDDVKFIIVMEATMIDKIVPITVSTFWKTVKPFVTCLVTFGADFFSSFDEWLGRE